MLEVAGLGARDHQNFAIRRDGAAAGQGQRHRVVVLAGQRFRDRRIAGDTLVRDVLLAVIGDEIDLLAPGTRHFDERIGDVFFRDGADAFHLVAGVEDDGPQTRNSEPLGALRILVEFLEMQAQQSIASDVLAQEIARRVTCSTIEVNVDVDAFADPLQDLLRLVRQAVLA